MEKIYELVVYRRLAFVNEAFECYDRYINGFLEWNRTSDNLFVLNALVEKQLVLSKRLYVNFIDFSKAFDMVNRMILFYKLISGGWKGRVIDTFRSLYGKTHFRDKRNGKLSFPVDDNLGVNQGSISSGLMFRKYMSDLSTYLSREVRIVISNEIIAHILWADDLILFSDSSTGLQKQLNGLLKFCSKNKIIVNETKTMCFGTDERFNLVFQRKTHRTSAPIQIPWCSRSVSWQAESRHFFLIITVLYRINLEKPHSVWTRILNINKIYHQGSGLICSIL